MNTPAVAPPARPTWREVLFNRRMLICVFTGFSSGLPLYLLINLLPAWLRSEQVDLKSIGLFALIQPRRESGEDADEHPPVEEHLAPCGPGTRRRGGGAHPRRNR